MIRMIRHRFSPGIRIQLVTWYVVVLTLLLFLFGTIFFVNFRTSLSSNFDSALQLRTQQLAASIQGENNTITMKDIQAALPWLFDGDDMQPNPEQKETYIDATLGSMMRFFNVKGQLIYTTPDFVGLHAPASSLNQPLHDISWLGTVTGLNGQRIRLNSIPLLEHGHVFGVVEAGASLAPLDATLQSVIVELLIALPIVLLFGIFVSYWIASRAFAPITRLTRVVRSIKAGNLHLRVPEPSARDEVQNLALTFNEMIDYLDAAFERQRRFVADASHELRTPVAAIRSMTDIVLAQHSSEGKDYDTILRMVNVQAERLGDLISDLLAMAAADEGKIVIERERVRLDRLAADVAATIEPLATERNITLEVQAQEPVVIIGDEARLMQVIMNLIDNAIAYTDAGGRVTLSVEAKEVTALLIVQDTGSGIAPEHQEHIFERFYRSDPARSRASGGSGLGLAIVDWVVRAHGGTISVKSTVGEGSIFTVALPLVSPAPA